MNTHVLALQLMAAQGCLGAFDTLFHHEFTEALSQRLTARRELAIHSARAMLYSVLFIGLAFWTWHGAWTIVLTLVFGIEIVLTLWDFVVEDRSRLLPATERVTHTVLAINGGGFITLLALNFADWFAQPTGLHQHSTGWLSSFLALCGVGVGLSGMRDASAALRLGRIAKDAGSIPPISFGNTAQSVLVTGATGFIGQHLVRALLRDGHQVVILSRRPKQAAWLFDGKVRCIESMSGLPASWRIDVVINLAGARILGRRWTGKRKNDLRRSRIGVTQSVVNWISKAEHKPFLFLSGSAIGYYGIQKIGDQTVLDETAPPQPMFMSDLCREWEDAAKAATAYGVRVECMRFGLVLGRQGALPMMLMPIRLGLGGRLGSGRQWLSWIHVEDVLGGMAHLWNQASVKAVPDAQQPGALAGVSNFTAPEVVSQQAFSETAARVWKRPCFFPTPGWPMRLALGEQADLLLEGQRVLPSRLQREGYEFRHPRLEQALRSLK